MLYLLLYFFFSQKQETIMIIVNLYQYKNMAHYPSPLFYNTEHVPNWNQPTLCIIKNPFYKTKAMFQCS